MAVRAQALGRIMYDLGLLPPETADLEILVPVDGVLRVRFTVNILEKDLPTFAEAFTRLAVQTASEPPPPPENTLMRR